MPAAELSPLGLRIEVSGVGGLGLRGSGLGFGVSGLWTEDLGFRNTPSHYVTSSLDPDHQNPKLGMFLTVLNRDHSTLFGVLGFQGFKVLGFSSLRFLGCSGLTVSGC